MRYPLDTVEITQPFGANSAYYGQFGLKGHDGIDLRTKIGGSFWNNLMGWQTAKAVADGICTATYGHPLYGNYVDLDCDLGTFRYAHLKNARPPTPDSVIPGAVLKFKVKEGDSVGITGASGNVSGPHLHFCFRPKNPDHNNGYRGWVDPIPVLNQPKTIRVAFIGVPVDPSLSDAVKAYSLGKMTINPVFYPSQPLTDFTTDAAMKLLEQVNPVERYCFIGCSANSGYDKASYHPGLNKSFAIMTSVTTDLLAHELLHCFRKYINANHFGYVEDVEYYPPSWRFEEQYQQLLPYLNNL